MKLKRGKVHFAETVVPSSNAKDFIEFEKLFAAIEQLIAQYAVVDEENIGKTASAEVPEVFG
ncbi:hypothetical protein V9K92_14970 [Phyllobacterium sp. CCNWLW109]|uniref:hypothetical protein n=1 Tax=Phyllobacterium sp. CCNWLW109 TaxID=3127479 RepID=UPI003077C4D6